MEYVNSYKRLFIDWTIEHTCPTGPGERNRRIFDFAQHLRTVYDKATDPDALWCHVEDWHQAALPYIRTMGFDETWRDFCHAWASVESPAGSTLAMVEQMANEDSFSLGLADTKLDRVARLLRAAARIHDKFANVFIYFRTMGKSVGLSAVAARKIAYRLVDLGLLAVVEKRTAATRGRATVWRWLGP
jgi:hypothetical protein